MQNTKKIPESRRCEPAKLYKKSSFIDIHEVLQSLRNDEILCDIKLETDDKKIIHAHKVVLSAGSPYFYAMFINFAERDQDIVTLRQIDYTALLLLVNFIYSGQILVNEENVQVLLPAANLLQLEEVKEACCEFLQSQLCPTNCIGIKAIADVYSCTKLIRCSDLYIYQHFSEVFGGDEFLSLSSEQVIKLISSDKLTVPSEEKVYESVISWVKYDLGSRKCILPLLMEHVRLPLISNDYILKNVVEDPLIKNCLKCNLYVSEALNTLKSEEFLPQSIHNTPRYGDKVILVIGGIASRLKNTTEWYDPKTKQWHFGPELINNRVTHGLALINDNLLFDVGGNFFDISLLNRFRSVDVLDLSSESPCWQPGVNMSVQRQFFGVGVINNNIYAVGGDNHLNTAEVFNYKTQEWRMISSMSARRSFFAVGVLNDLLYAVGGFNHSSQTSDTVECYNPRIDMWTPVANLCVGRSCAGVGTLFGELYAVGGKNGSNLLRSVEKYRPSTGVWTTIADIHIARKHAGVFALDGLLYVVGGTNQFALDSVECYNPITNTWAMDTATMNGKRSLPGVIAINRPHHFTS